jgi:hypothetical protein
MKIKVPTNDTGTNRRIIVDQSLRKKRNTPTNHRWLLIELLFDGSIKNLETSYEIS